MAKNAYMFSWTGPRTGWDYQYIVREAGAADSTTSMNLTSYDPADIVDMKLPWEYEEWPIGFAPASMEIAFKIGKLDPGLQDILTEPFYSTTAHFTPSSGWISGTDISFGLVTSTIHDLYIKFNGLETTPAYRLVYRGAQTNGIEDSLDPIKGEITVQTQAIYKSILEAIPTSKFQDLYKKDSAAISGQVLHEILFSNNGNAVSILTVPPGTVQGPNHYFWMFDFEKLKDYISSLGTAVYSAYMRESTDFSLDFFPAPEYYKQDYSGDGSRGSVLTSVYFPGLIANKSFSNRESSELSLVGGMFVEMQEDYKSAWDYIYDVYQDGLRKAYFDFSSGQLASVLLGGNVGGAIDLSRAKFDKMGLHAQIVKRASAEIIEFTDDDVSKYEEVAASARKDNTIVCPIVHTNIPANYDVFTDSQHEPSNSRWKEYFKLAGDPRYARKFQIHTYGVYYYEKPTYESVDLVKESVFIRVHENCNIEWMSSDSDTEISLDYYDFQARYFTASDFYDIPVFLAELQASTGKHVIMAKTLMHLFSNNYQSTISGECELNNGIGTFIGPVSVPWLHGAIDVSIDITEFAPDNNPDLLDNYFTDWYLLSSEIDFKNETVKFEGLSHA